MRILIIVVPVIIRLSMLAFMAFLMQSYTLQEQVCAIAVAPSQLKTTSRQLELGFTSSRARVAIIVIRLVIRIVIRTAIRIVIRIIIRTVIRIVIRTVIRIVIRKVIRIVITIAILIVLGAEETHSAWLVQLRAAVPWYDGGLPGLQHAMLTRPLPLLLVRSHD